MRPSIILILGILLSDFAYSQSLEKTPVSIQDVVPAETVQRLKAIYEDNEFSAESFSASWIPGSSGYLVLEDSPEANDQTLVRYDAASGTRTELVSASQLELPGSTDSLF
ncbi:MAG: hypothetical protein R3281_07970, partial [Balneolaceae bacterium]|nr:hypothetical protein [Balneolaceae bacterium]